MIKEIQTRNFELTKAMRQHFNLRIEHILGRYEDCISSVETRIMTIQEEHGQNTLLLRMVIVPKSGATLFLDQHHPDFFTLIDATCEKINEALSVFFVLDLKTEEVSSTVPHVAA